MAVPLLTPAEKVMAFDLLFGEIATGRLNISVMSAKGGVTHVNGDCACVMSGANHCAGRWEYPNPPHIQRCLDDKGWMPCLQLIQYMEQFRYGIQVRYCTPGIKLVEAAYGVTIAARAGQKIAAYNRCITRMKLQRNML